METVLRFGIRKSKIRKSKGMTQLISREKLEHIARKILHYPLHDAEKDYFLTLAMKLVLQSQLSNKCLGMYPEMIEQN